MIICYADVNITSCLCMHYYFVITYIYFFMFLSYISYGNTMFIFHGLFYNIYIFSNIYIFIIFIASIVLISLLYHCVYVMRLRTIVTLYKYLYYYYYYYYYYVSSIFSDKITLPGCHLATWLIFTGNNTVSMTKDVELMEIFGSVLWTFQQHHNMSLSVLVTHIRSAQAPDTRAN